ncbi:MAG: DUF2490 domain-containing protein [Bacteroidota bacterium]
MQRNITKKSNRVLILCLGLLLAYLSAFSQEKEGTGTWMLLSGSHQISEKLKIPTVGILRYASFMDENEFGFLRTGLTYTPNDTFHLTMGIAYLDTEPFEHDQEDIQTTQFWLYEEFSLHLKFGTVPLSQRFRVEQRWVHKPETDDFNHRFRYRLQWTHAISKKIYLKISDEPFVGLSKLAINQNRFYSGLGYKFSDKVRFEMGYMKNHIGKDNYDLAQITLQFKTNIIRKNQFDTASKNKF